MVETLMTCSSQHQQDSSWTLLLNKVRVKRMGPEFVMGLWRWWEWTDIGLVVKIRKNSGLSHKKFSGGNPGSDSTLGSMVEGQG